MSERRAGLGMGGLALLPIACCIGIPLIAAAGLSVAAAALIGGAALAAIALAAAVVLHAIRAWTRRRMTPLVSPHERSTR
jgi:hypothetical protein